MNSATKKRKEGKRQIIKEASSSSIKSPLKKGASWGFGGLILGLGS